MKVGYLFHSQFLVRLSLVVVKINKIEPFQAQVLILLVSCPAVRVQKYAVVETRDCDGAQNKRAAGNGDATRNLE
jgi:hypothetical protein